MLQCSQCEFFSRRPDGSPVLKCDPFSNIKEPHCLDKWQVYHLLTSSKAQQAMQSVYERLAPLQEKMFQHMEREIDETEDADRWKYGGDDDDLDEFETR